MLKDRVDIGGGEVARFGTRDRNLCCCIQMLV